MDRLNRLLHPAFLLALVVLLLNDHVLKDAVGNALTGKLSDLAGLVVLPVLLTTLFGLRSRPLVWAVHGTVGLAFAAVQFVPESTLWALGLPVRHTPDPTDLLALAMLPFGVWLSLTGPRQLEVRPWLAHGVGLVAVCAVLATAPPLPPPVVTNVPVLRAANPIEGFLALEKRLEELGFRPRLERSPFVPYSEWLKRPSTSPYLSRDSTEWRGVYEQQRRAYEQQRGSDDGREHYTVLLSGESCPQFEDSPTVVLRLTAEWHPRPRELALFTRGWGLRAPNDDATGQKQRQILTECLVGPLRDAAGMQRLPAEE